MKRIIQMLLEARLLQLRKRGLVTREAEVTQMFEFLDVALGGVRLNSDGTFDDPETKLQEAMISADFTFAIQEFIQRRMLPTYTAKAFNFEAFMPTDEVPNFLPVTRYQDRSSVDDLEWVAEKGAVRPGYRRDVSKFQWRVHPYEKGYDFSMQTLVNDDLGFFNTQTSKMGRSARRSLEKFVSRMLNNATGLAYLLGLGALYYTTGRLTSGRISTARMAFAQRVDATNEPIQASLRYIVHHSGLADVVSTIQQSTLVPENSSNAANVVRAGWTPIEDPYMAGTAPDLPWLALVDWRSDGIQPLVLARRTGMPGPLILRKKSDIENVTSLVGPGTPAAPIMGDFATGNIQIKVYDEWGTYIDASTGNWIDERGVYYGAGTTP